MAEIVNFFWMGDSLGIIEQISLKSYIKHGYQVDVYSYDKQLKGLPAGASLKDANEIIPFEKFYTTDVKYKNNPTDFSDFFRAKLLYQRGGYWSDCDAVCLKPYSFPTEVVISKEETRDVVRHTPVSCGIMKFPAKSLYLEIILKRFERPRPILFLKFLRELKRLNLAAAMKALYGFIFARGLNVYKYFGWGELGGPSAYSWIIVPRLAAECVYSAQTFYPVYFEEIKKIFEEDISFGEDVYSLHLYNGTIKKILDETGVIHCREGSTFHKLVKEYLPDVDCREIRTLKL